MPRQCHLPPSLQPQDTLTYAIEVEDLGPGADPGVSSNGEAILGWELREAGKAKRSMKAMSQDEERDAGEVTTTFVDL